MKLRFFNKDIVSLKKQTDNIITFSFTDSLEEFNLYSQSLQNEVLIASNIKCPDDIIAVVNYKNLDYYIHTKSSNIYISPYLNGKTEMSIDLDIDNVMENYQVKLTEYSYQILDENNNKYELDYNIFITGSVEIDSLKPNIKNKKIVYARCNYNHYTIFIQFHNKKSCFLLRTIKKSILFSNFNIGLSLISFNTFKLSNISDERIKRNYLHRNKSQIIKAKKNIEKFNVFLIKINNRLYVVEYLNSKQIKISYDKKIDLLLKSSNVKTKVRKSGILFIINLKHYFENIKVDSIINKEGIKLAKIKKVSKDKFSFHIPFKKILKLNTVHNTLFVSYQTHKLYPLHLKLTNEPKKRILCCTNFKNYSFISRINLANNIAITILPKSELYSRFNLFKVRIANILAPFVRLSLKKNINLFFEKDASSANESGFKVFEEVNHLENVESINKFIIDINNEKFHELKKLYGKDIIKRYSFSHYIYLFAATNFISSELSNHVLAVRVYNDLLNDKIRRTPLYFLQHGIMFAKPVDNPMALGFHKSNQVNNLKKSVISSDLEAKEFYKMGYTENDLIKTGLPKLDSATLNVHADKIAYMPTWRYWEEGSIIRNDIENTTYYQSLIEVIYAFEKASLLDRLLIVPHNKFAEYIKDNLVQYRDIISTDPSEALKNSVIFITDYSSIIYDAIYRGAYPIFYWKEKDYLIKHYKATPPVNEKNAPGKIATSPQGLIDFVKIAMESNYEIPVEITKKYMKINEFNDNRNTYRVIKELQKLKVL